jgi:hypothetical protein
MKNKLLFAVFCSLFVLSCDKSDDVKPKRVTYFELSVAATYPTENSDDWIIIHDANGALLSVKQFESGQNITFDSTIAAPDKLSITFLKATLGNNQDSYTFKSYPRIAAQDKWTLDLKTSTFNPGTNLGELSVQVNDENIGSEWDTQISSQYGYSTQASSDNPPNLVFPGKNLYSNADDVFLFVTEKDGTPRYKFVENAIPGSFTYSLADFTTFDKFVDFKFPPTSQWLLLVYGTDKNVEEYIDTQSYTVNAYLSGFSDDNFFRSDMPAAYLDRFPTYFTTLYLSYGNYALTYQSLGAVPDAVTMQKDEITTTITNEDISGYALSSSDFDWRETEWRANVLLDGKYRNLLWLTTSDNTNTANPPLPEVITKKYPAISLDAFDHVSTRLYKGNRGYTDIINERFKGVALKSYAVKGKTF